MLTQNMNTIVNKITKCERKNCNAEHRVTIKLAKTITPFSKSSSRTIIQTGPYNVFYSINGNKPISFIHLLTHIVTIAELNSRIKISTMQLDIVPGRTSLDDYRLRTLITYEDSTLFVMYTNQFNYSTLPKSLLLQLLNANRYQPLIIKLDSTAVRTISRNQIHSKHKIYIHTIKI